MKRTLTVLLILALILTAPAALAGDADPIVGCWYILYNFAAGPAAGSVGYTHSVIVFLAQEDGSVWVTEIDYSGENTNVIGPVRSDGWTKTDGQYAVSINPGFSGKAYLEGSNLYVQLAEGVYYLAHKMWELDWNYDIKNELQMLTR